MNSIIVHEHHRMANWLLPHHIPAQNTGRLQHYKTPYEKHRPYQGFSDFSGLVDNHDQMWLIDT
jgi:hypothetical protein